MWFDYHNKELIMLSFCISILQFRRLLQSSEEAKCAFSNCLHLGEPGCILEGKTFERYSYYFQLFDEIRIREEFQLRTFGTKREGDVRYVIFALR